MMVMGWKAILAVTGGSAAGGLLRWGLSLRIQSGWVWVPAGTLMSNCLAAYIAGTVLGVATHYSGLSQVWRLLIITGFCGGLSTFSTFSLEVVGLVERGAYGGAALTVIANLFGSLLLTAAGLLSAHFFFKLTL